MFALKVIVTILNLIFAFVMYYFSKGLFWDNPDDRFSIVGFCSMIVLYFANILVIWI